MAVRGDLGMSDPLDTRRPVTLPTGSGLALALLYGLFAIAAGARAAVQITREISDAPVAYGLSALAAAVYVIATVALLGRAHRVALVAVGFELLGVLVVGSLSLLHPEYFPRATVWSGFGAGYGWLPLLLPILGLAWLRYNWNRGPQSPESN